MSVILTLRELYSFLEQIKAGKKAEVRVYSSMFQIDQPKLARRRDNVTSRNKNKGRIVNRSFTQAARNVTWTCLDASPTKNNWEGSTKFHFRLLKKFDEKLKTSYIKNVVEGQRESIRNGFAEHNPNVDSVFAGKTYHYFSRYTKMETP